jgi:hypothetical protein
MICLDRRVMFVSKGGGRAVGITTGYRLEVRGAGVRVPVESRVSLLHIVQTGSGANPAYQMGTGSFLPGVKWQRRETDYSPPTSAESRKRGAIHLLSHTP